MTVLRQRIIPEAALTRLVRATKSKTAQTCRPGKRSATGALL
ncbi:hypothetical protein CSC12_5105 [Klebsiella michiganensis]|nr:hypothetical protein CSC12_5105 [Klebsiella michiganensis]